LLLFVPNQILDFLVLFSQEPVELIDFGNEGFNLMDVARDEISGILLLDVLVLDFDVDHFAAVELLQSHDLIPQSCVLLLQQPQLLLVPVL
jgi:hypothetical protein